MALPTISRGFGSRRVMQEQLGEGIRGGGGGITISGRSRCVAVAVDPGDWTADTTGYPDAADLGNQTLYKTVLAHSLGSIYADAPCWFDGAGRKWTNIIVQVNTDANNTTVWISQDTSPASSLVFLCYAP